MTTVSVNVHGQTSGNPVTDLLLSAWSPRNFTGVPVTEQQLDLIVRCGLKAPSSRNNQPWKFTVVQNEVLMKELIGNVVPGNALIVISGVVSPSGATPDFDCGLATQNMFTAATALGLGARIYGGPVAAANNKKDLIKIPEGYRIVIILRVGNIEKSVDGVSGASPRKSFDEIVTWFR